MIFNIRDSERGQALILFTFALIGIMAAMALVIDGGRIFVERSHAQNAADNAVLASALAKCTGEADILTPGYTYAAKHGYDDDNTNNWVTINSPPASGPYAGEDNYIESLVRSRISSSFVHLVYQGPLEVTARAVAECDPGGSSEGFPPEPFSIFGGSCPDKEPIDFAGNLNNVYGPTYNSGIWKLSGADNNFYGTMHTNGDTILSGNSNDFWKHVTYSGDYDESGINNIYHDGRDQIAPLDNSWPLTADDFIIDNYKPGGIYASDPNYYYADEHILSGSIPEGIYYSETKIDINTANITGTVTLVAVDEINISGNNSTLYPYINNLLLLVKGDKCDAAAVSFSGNESNWNGIVYSPDGMIDMSGNANGSTLDGCLWGARVILSGEDITVQNCADYMSQSTVSLVE